MEQRFTALEWAAMEGGQEVATPTVKLSLPFLQELTEARMYRGSSTLQGKTADELAKVVFLMFMMLEILRKEDAGFAKKYAKQTLWHEKFSTMRTNASDLHNLLSVLSNQQDFSSKIATNANINVPALQIRRYLRDIDSGLKQQGVDRAFFKTLEEFLKISDSNLKEIRRAVADWRDAGATEKSTIRYKIKNLLHMTNQQNDLLIQFRTKL
jgi:hypothetical protein